MSVDNRTLNEEMLVLIFAGYLNLSVEYYTAGSDFTNFSSLQNDNSDETFLASTSVLKSL